MKKVIKDKEDDLFLIDLLLESNLSLVEIAKEINISISDLKKKISSLGLNWIKDSKKKTSRGQAALTDVMKKLFPNQEIINEYHIGDRLKLDVYCPAYKIAAEFHGRQHFYYTKRFFSSKEDFIEAQRRDVKKAEMCEKLGIILVVFRYNDSLSEQSVYDRLLDAIRNSDFIPVEEKKNKKSITQNKFYQESKKRYNQKKKENYRKMKQRKGNHE